MTTYALAPVSIIDMSLLSLEFHCDGQPADGNAEIAFSQQAPVYQEDEEGVAVKVWLGVTVNVPREDAGDVPRARICAQAKGLFGLVAEDAQPLGDRAKSYLRQNALSLLYGFLRGHVSSVTAASDAGDIILPPMVPGILAAEFDGAGEDSQDSGC